MNKFGIVMSLAAVTAITGCLDPDYKRPSAIAPKPAVVEPAKPAEPAPAAVEQVKEEPKSEEKPIQEFKPVEEAKPAPQPEVTTYIVQNGDYLSKISKKFNIKVSAIKAANGLKDDRIRVGQKLKLPGKVEVGEQKTPETRKAAAKSSPKTTASTVYKGTVKEYVVKSGDTLGGIAYSNGLSTRQLKALNNLSSDKLSVGQKLQVPAEKPVAEKAKGATDAKVNKTAEKKPLEKAAEAKTENADSKNTAASAEPSAPAVDEVKVEDKAADSGEQVKTDEVTVPVVKAQVVESAETYVVQDGDDVMSIAVRFNTSSNAIRELNNLGEDDQLKVGSVLKLPPDASEVE